jgi:hypothetical protein
MIRANTLEELEPLLAMCREGRLFDVQGWIGEGRPVALPADAGVRKAKRNPLRVAIDSGFHSLVQVLLEAGAPVREGRYVALGACSTSPNSTAVSWLLERGHSPKLLADRGTRAISSLLNSMSWDFSINRTQGFLAAAEKPGIDSERSRERLKMIHLLVAHGGMWLPSTPHTVADARKCLLKMRPDYALEFIWLMHEYRAARRRDVQELIRTPSMARHLQNERPRVTRLVAGIPEEPLADVHPAG